MALIEEAFIEYVERPGVHWSDLKEMRRSAKRYLFRKSNPMEDRPTLLRGRATHTAVLEPDRFILDYAVFQGAIRRGKEWNACCAANRGKTILKVTEYAAALSTRDAVRSHAVAGPLMSKPGRSELTVTWTDEETGLDCKGRIDRLVDFTALVDLKSTTDVDVGRFAQIAARLGYHGQGAFYREGLRRNGIDLPVKLVAVEVEEPYDVAVFSLDEDTLYAGDELWREGLRRVAECEATKEWPGRYGQEVPLILPAWAFPVEDEADQGLDALGLEPTAQEA